MDVSGVAIGSDAVTRKPSDLRPLLTVVVPVYNGGDEVVDNVGVIQRAVTAGLPGEAVETIVVSDGSIDGSSERLLAARSDVGIRVIHYDRNLGKGYAVKVGALASRGDWVAIIDADLDLDPASIPTYLDVAREERLDFAIGSKRHPDSVVRYPPARRAASWLYQQLNRALFQLDVNDTQVGLKVFSREVVDDVLPVLLVKQFAFDLELLAVASALGYRRIRELPVRLEYRFTGSELRSRAVVRALWDTAAIFHRLRILRTYQRRRLMLGGVSFPRDDMPRVTLMGDPGAAELLDYPRLDGNTREDRPRAEDGGGRAELIAILAPGSRPAGNWVTASVPYFADHGVAAVVVPTLAPPDATVRERAAAAVLESRLGGGSRRSRYFPGNVRVVFEHPAGSIVVRRQDYESAFAENVENERLVGWLAKRGRRTIYTPDTSVTTSPPPLFGPHLRATIRHAEARALVARRMHGASLSGETALSLAPAACAVLGVTLIRSGSPEVRRVGAGLVAVYGAAVAASAGLAALRFNSARIGALAVPGLIATQVAYVAGFVRGLARRQ